jgi:hypothetical protein
VPVNIQLLNQLIVGLPKSLASQATTDTSQSYTGSLQSGKMYVFISNKTAHLKFGSYGSSPTVTVSDFLLPANQFYAIATDKDIDLSIIRGADETSNGKLWVSELLETAVRL